MKSRRHSSLVPGLSLVLVILAIALGIVLAAIPGAARSIFGPPSDSLSSIDRLILSIKLLANQDALLMPAGPGEGLVNVTIESGDPVASIANRMQAAGLILDANAWVDFLVYSGMDVSLQAGRYRLDPAQNAVSIAQAMQDPNIHQISFPILAGWRLEEVAASLPTSGLVISPDEFLAVAGATAPGGIDGRLPQDTATLEGYLLPGEYMVVRAISLPGLLAVILGNFGDLTSGELSNGFYRQGLSLSQAVTLASIVEREAIQPDEMPVIASVFLNRLSVGMPLESDPTVQYALGFDPGLDTWWKVPLEGSDLSVNSLFNTYLVYGLPPAPICNPSRQALQAVADPATTGFYFFRAACDGSGRHVFSVTYDQHLSNACP